MCIPGAVPQPLNSDETNNVRMSLPHTCTFLHMSLESNGRQEPHFDYHHKELDVNDVETCLPWGWDMLLGDGGYSLNVWDGESLENRFQLDRKGKVEECQHATLLNVPFKYFYLLQGFMVHGGAMDNALTNGALRLHMYLIPGATSDRHSVAITKRAGNAIKNTKACGRKRTPP